MRALWGTPPPTATDVRDALSGLDGQATVDAIATEYGVDADPATAFTDIINVVLDSTVSTTTGLKKDKCDFWDTIE